MPTVNKPTGRLPDFIIIGATKTGTTSLDVFLSASQKVRLGIAFVGT
jgi:hypothetical protein